MQTIKLVFLLSIFLFKAGGLSVAIYVNPTCVDEGGSVTVTCEPPKANVTCNLYKRLQTSPFMTEKANWESCVFSVSAKKLLDGESHVGPVTVVRVRCEYTVDKRKVDRTFWEEVHVLGRLQAPTVSVVPTTFSGTESVGLSCQAPQTLGVSGCKFYLNGRLLSDAPSCKTQFRGTDLLMGRNNNNVLCIYTVGPKVCSEAYSPYSDAVTVALPGHLPQAMLKVSVAVIRKTDSVQLSCLGPPSVPVSQCHFFVEGKALNDNSACQLSLTGAELLRDRSYGAVTELTVDCLYIVEAEALFSGNHIITVLDLTPPNISVLLDDSQAVVNCEAPPHITGTLFHMFPSTGIRRVTQLAAAGESAVSFTVPHSHGSSYCCSYQYHNFTSQLSDCTGPGTEDEEHTANMDMWIFGIAFGLQFLVFAVIWITYTYKMRASRSNSDSSEGEAPYVNTGTT